MKDFLINALMSSPAARRIAWRSSRRLYSIARGEEQRPDSFSINGEGYVQECAIHACAGSGAFAAVDVGANQGDWTVCLLERLPPGTRARIDLFEPAPRLADKLRVRLAGIDKSGVTKLHGAAVSDSPGTARLAIMSDHGGTNSLSFDADTAKQALAMVDVEKVTLSGFCDAEAIPHVHLAKCDAEGHDLLVLRGARDMLAAGRIDVFQFEYNYRWIFARAFLKDVFELVEGLPYKVARVQPRSLEVFETWHPELDRFFQSNYVLVREPALKWFATGGGRFDDTNTCA